LLQSIGECQALARDWNAIRAEQGESMTSLGVTSSFEWAMVLWHTRLQGQDQTVLVLERDGRIAGILPLYFSRRSLHGVRCRVLAPISEIYSGRDGFLLRGSRDEDLETLIGYLTGEVSGWDALLFTVVEGSPSETLASALARGDKYRCQRVWSTVSPYITLNKSWPAFFEALPKQLRTNLRAAERRLRGAGTVGYEEFADRMSLPRFLETVLHIERHSWKEQEKTSITTNPHQQRVYEKLAEVAAGNGWLSGHLLFLDGEPLAYIYGLQVGGVFYDLKSSFQARFGEFSPGNLLTRFVLERLSEHGVRFYDFRGACELYKMRWTQSTYTCHSYLLYNRTVRAKVSRFAGMVRRPVGRHAQAG
jgi:CelD/BcsL family acetyltransferase involved in cellulose biosynthesis